MAVLFILMGGWVGVIRYLLIGETNTLNYWGGILNYNEKCLKKVTLFENCHFLSSGGNIFWRQYLLAAISSAGNQVMSSAGNVFCR